MATDRIENGIYNDGTYIKIAYNGNVTEVNKCQIKTIDTVRDDVVRLDIGEGALKNIYIRISDVRYPNIFNDVTVLRNYIRDLMIHDGFSTEVKQDAAVSQLEEIKNILLSIQNVFAAGNYGSGAMIKLPLREDDSQPNIIYRGFAAPNASASDPLWAIEKITRIDNQIIYEWADGNQNYQSVWDSRYILTYHPLGFLSAT